ncbi:hypothetical protein QFZ27_002127 [Inquilinus ginsengisoli]|uniref:hypothetical protein n=1 Tax=Inquilinus ginsengisoli TaxID=363840 RepID=UPI003D251644
MAKSWTEKLDDPRPHQVKPAPVDIAGMKTGEIMLVPTPRLIDAFIRAIPKGSGMDVPTLRRELASQHGAEVTCPITTGFHLRIVAEAAWEAHRRGTPASEITPFWRVLDGRAPTTAKLSFGDAFLHQQRRLEGLA